MVWLHTISATVYTNDGILQRPRAIFYACICINFNREDTTNTGKGGGGGGGGGGGTAVDITLSLWNQCFETKHGAARGEGVETKHGAASVVHAKLRR